ncbi:MAG: sacsin N-terminal ATP-binding-like domain-containing protein [Janthinobacterium lividum]
MSLPVCLDFRTNDDLQVRVEALYRRNCVAAPELLEDLAHIEDYVQQSYAGRSLFELLQNGRDAAQVAGQSGTLEIELVVREEAAWLLVRNTGAPLTPAGVEGLTRFGKSTKPGVNTIGHKGLGFKAVRQLSDAPRLVTRWGTLLFDATRTQERYTPPPGEPAPARLPLFYLPHYAPGCLTPQELTRGVATRVELPLRNAAARALVEADLTGLRPRQLVLLNYVRELQVHRPTGSVRYEFIKGSKDRLDVRQDGLVVERYRQYATTLALPPEVVATASPDEQAILAQMEHVDVRLLLDVDAQGRFVLPPKPPALYLYYPLRLLTGFRFLIHSFFLVDPARVQLQAQCPTNTFLLTEIGRFIGGELVRRLTAVGYDPVPILCYERRNEEELGPLYNAAQAQLQQAAFIRLKRPGEPVRYLKPAQVRCAEPALCQLLPAGQVDGQYLVPVADPLARAWLQNELDVAELTPANLGAALAQECRRQRGNPEFFRQLYKFIAAQPTLDLRPYRLLLTQAGKLVAAGPTPVFYAARAGGRPALPAPLGPYLHLLHPALALGEPLLRALEARLGLRPLQPENLATHLLQLLGEGQPPELRSPVLRALKDLAREVPPTGAWLSQVWLPVQDGNWVRPWQRPVYLPSPELLQLYPAGLFIDRSRWPLLTGDDTEWHDFLRKVGAWDKPGLYVADTERYLAANDPRNPSIREWLNRSTNPVLRHDRVLDVPAQPTEWFTRQLVEHWPAYRAWLMQQLGRPFSVGSAQGSQRFFAPAEQVPEWCGVTHYLRTAAWVVRPGRTAAEPVTQLVGLSPGVGGRWRRVEEFLPVWHLDPDQHQGFCAAMELTHLTSRHLSPRQGLARLGRTLHQLPARYPMPPAEAAAEFREGYNQLLAKLLEYWDDLSGPLAQQEALVPLRELQWLAQADEHDTLRLHWRPAHELLYLDDKPAYDQLLRDVQALPAKQVSLPPALLSQFTLRDATGFGRLARHLGRRFTTVLERTLQPGEATAAEPLRTSKLVAPAALPRLVALLETYRQRRFTAADLAQLGAVPVRRSPHLLVAFRLRLSSQPADNVTFDLEQPYFLAPPAAGEIHPTLYVQQAGEGSGVAGWRPTAEALAALLPQLFEFSLPYLRHLLPDVLTTTDWTAFDRKHDLSADRLAELHAELLPPNESAAANFWQGIRQALGQGGACGDELWADLPLPPDLPARVAAAFAAAGGAPLPQQASTRTLLLDLSRALGLPAAALHQHLRPVFHFQELLEAEWRQARDQGRTDFAARLHASLQPLPAEQADYRRYLRRYEQLSRPLTPPAHWQPDYAALLPARCAEAFAPCLLACPALPPPHDPHSQYTQALRTLRRKVAASPTDAALLDDFLQQESRDSLLYFGRVAEVAAAFGDWQQQRRVAESAADPAAHATLPVNPPDFAQPVGRLVAPPPRPAGEAASGDGGASSSTREAQLNREHVGRRAEERVWVWLRARGYGEVTWVSANARRVADTHPAYNRLGSDRHHYDLRYLDAAGETVYVEVKGTTGPALEGYLSRAELAFAERQLPGRYQLLFVTRALDDAACQLFPLGNPFLYTAPEDCWHNPRFRAEADMLRIAFTMPAEASTTTE